MDKNQKTNYIIEAQPTFGSATYALNGNAKKPTVGFIILTWNSEKVIGECLQSIFELSVLTPLVVVIDNGSMDGTRGIIDSYYYQYPEQMSIISFAENVGTTVSRNAGIRYLMSFSPDYYCILDSDTRINDDAFSDLINVMDTNSDYGILGPTMITSSGVIQMSARSFPTMLEKFCKAVPVKRIQAIGERMEVQPPPQAEADSYPVDYLMSACWLIKPEVLTAAGLLDEKIFYAPEDAEYCIRVWKAGYKVAFCPKARIIHEWQRLSKKKLISKINLEHIKGLVYMFQKHHYFFSADKLRKTF